MDPITDPPGIHRSVDRADEMPATAKAMYAAIVKRETVNLNDALALGRLLIEIKKKAGHGKWLPLLKDIGIPQRTAQDYIMISKLAAPLISKCTSIREAMRLLKWLDGLCESCFHLVSVKLMKAKKKCPACARRRRDMKRKAAAKEDKELREAAAAIWDDKQFDEWVGRGIGLVNGLAVKGGYIDPKTNEPKPPPHLLGVLRKVQEIEKEMAKIVKEFRKQAEKDLFQEKGMPQ